MRYMANENNKYSYPQKYFLIPEACRHFGLKLRTFKAWRDGGLEIPGLHKVKGSNYYVIEPVEFHKWLVETRLEPAKQTNKFHSRKPRLSSHKGGKSRDDVKGVVRPLSAPTTNQTLDQRI